MVVNWPYNMNSAEFKSTTQDTNLLGHKPIELATPSPLWPMLAKTPHFLTEFLVKFHHYNHDAVPFDRYVVVPYSCTSADHWSHSSISLEWSMFLINCKMTLRVR